MAKWTKRKEPVSCPFAKKEKKKFGFDVTKVDRIFDLLLQEGQIKLSANHTDEVEATSVNIVLFYPWNTRLHLMER